MRIESSKQQEAHYQFFLDFLVLFRYKGPHDPCLRTAVSWSLKEPRGVGGSSLGFRHDEQYSVEVGIT